MGSGPTAAEFMEYSRMGNECKLLDTAEVKPCSLSWRPRLQISFSLLLSLLASVLPLPHFATEIEAAISLLQLFIALLENWCVVIPFLDGFPCLERLSSSTKCWMVHPVACHTANWIWCYKVCCKGEKRQSLGGRSLHFCRFHAEFFPTRIWLIQVWFSLDLVWSSTSLAASHSWQLFSSQNHTCQRCYFQVWIVSLINIHVPAFFL